ncbi:hypothetical protein FG04937.1 [Paecilomyces variotii No. 5]|uniref:Uncharacterized protein n=1 Tax=Byssochlamys spectabilis (strain No. 5 / NBRC 109023) TaxID=1356009 RepID=V5I4L1_BYSSN|nr:hypothetical protein FG04937.1 [Paecilomyces variotii No. 5]
MEKAFYFVDGIQPDRTSKKLMRRHVMKGKNAGRKLQRASRAGLPIHLHQPKSIGPVDVNRGPYAGERGVAPDTIDKTFEDPILVGSLPVAEVDQYSLQIINQFFSLTAERLYPITLGFSLDEGKLMWLQLLFTDEAAYHCNISLMQACNEIYLGNGSSTTKALYHLSQTFRQVQRRLESKDSLSDSTIGLVLFLIMQEQIRNQGPAAEIHASGLKKMVELRGGLNQLDGNLNLILKVCNCPSRPILDLLGFEELFISTCYRLLRFMPIMDPTGQINSQTACHLGLLIFTVTTFFQLGQNRMIDFKGLSLRFQDVLSSDLGEVDDNMSLWFMTIGGVWYWNDFDNVQVASRLRQLVQQRGINSWRELRSHLYEFPWIQAVHDKPGHKLWNQIQYSS